MKSYTELYVKRKIWETNPLYVDEIWPSNIQENCIFLKGRQHTYDSFGVADRLQPFHKKEAHSP